MIEILGETSGKIFALKITGRLTGEDYKKVTAYLDEEIEFHRPIRLLCITEDLTGVDLEAMWEDLKFGLRHLHDFERIAVVGDEKWLEWLTKLGDHFLREAEVRWFEPTGLDAARQWINE
jgi:universal stress protein A